MRLVTRMELIDHVESAFHTAPVTRDALIAAAEASDARPEVIAVLHTLPPGPYRHPRDLWDHLEIPITH